MRKAAVALGVLGALLAFAVPVVMSLWAFQENWGMDTATMSPEARDLIRAFSTLGFFLGIGECLIVAAAAGLNGMSPLSHGHLRSAWTTILYAGGAVVNVCLPTLASGAQVGPLWVFLLTLPTLLFAAAATSHAMSCWGAFRVWEPETVPATRIGVRV